MTKSSDRFKGVFTALVTPFRDGTVDHRAYDALVARQLEAGVAGLVPVGTTGEAATLSDDEAVDLISRTVKAARGRAVVLAGAGANDTKKAVDKAKAGRTGGGRCSAGRHALLQQADPGGAASPTMMRRGLRRLRCPSCLYSVPGRCGVEIAPATCAELVKHACQHHRHQGGGRLGGPASPSFAPPVATGLLDPFGRRRSRPAVSGAGRRSGSPAWSRILPRARRSRWSRHGIAGDTARALALHELAGRAHRDHVRGIQSRAHQGGSGDRRPCRPRHASAAGACRVRQPARRLIGAMKRFGASSAEFQESR